MRWYPEQDREEEEKDEEEEEEEEEGAGENDRQTDWLCGMAMSVAVVVMHPSSAEFRIRVLESSALLRSAVLHRPCWRQQHCRLLWLN